MPSYAQLDRIQATVVTTYKPNRPEMVKNIKVLISQKGNTADFLELVAT
jgi:fructoselysine-6-P-deglycase FrlB-like protein